MAEKEKTTQEFIKETLLPTQYKVADNIIQKMFPEKYREYRKFDAKLGTETIEGAFDIGATIVDVPGGAFTAVAGDLTGDGVDPADHVIPAVGHVEIPL